MKIDISEWSGRSFEVDTELIKNRDIAHDIEVHGNLIMDYLEQYLDED